MSDSCSVKVIADSISPFGCRLTTIEARYWRAIHSELLTHRVLSKNSASSRAIPIAKTIQMVDEDPFVPIFWGKNMPGMSAREEIEDKQAAIDWWLTGKQFMIEHAKRGMELGLHKQLVNRCLEPYSYITIICSFTDPRNFLSLRDHPDAEPHFQQLAALVKSNLNNSQPRALQVGEWHLPLINFDDEIDKQLSQEDMIKISVGRCARVSYLTHDGKREPAKDVELHDKLLNSGHFSPFEHVAMCAPNGRYYGNFRGWRQYRKTLKYENVRTKLGLVNY